MRKRASYSSKGIDAILKAMQTTKSNKKKVDESTRVIPKKVPESREKRLINSIMRVNNACVNGFFSSKHIINITEQLDDVMRLGKELLESGGSNTELFLSWDTFIANVKDYTEQKEAKRREIYLSEEIELLEEKMFSLRDKKRLWGAEHDYLESEWTPIARDLESIKKEIEQITTSKKLKNTFHTIISLLNQFHHKLRTSYTEYFNMLIIDKSAQTRVVSDCCFIVKQALQGADLSADYKPKDEQVGKVIKKANHTIRTIFDPEYELKAETQDEPEQEVHEHRVKNVTTTKHTSFSRLVEENYMILNGIDKEIPNAYPGITPRPKVELTPSKNKREEPHIVKVPRRDKSVSDLTGQLDRATTEKNQLIEKINRLKNMRNSLKNTRSSIIRDKTTERELIRNEINSLKKEIEAKRQEYLGIQRDLEKIKNKMNRKSVSINEFAIDELEAHCAHYSGMIKVLQEELNVMVHLTTTESIPRNDSYSSEFPQQSKFTTPIRLTDYSYSEHETFQQEDAKIAKEYSYNCSGSGDYSNEPNVNLSDDSQDLGDFDMNAVTQEHPMSKSTPKTKFSDDHEHLIAQNKQLKSELADIKAELESLEFEKNEMLVEPDDAFKVIQALKLHTETVINSICNYKEEIKEEEHRIKCYIDTQPFKTKNCIREVILYLEQKLEHIRKATIRRTTELENMNTIQEGNIGIRKQIHPVTIADVFDQSKTAFLKLEKSRGKVSKTAKKITAILKEFELVSEQAKANECLLTNITGISRCKPGKLLMRIETENAQMAAEIENIERTIQSILRKYVVGAPKSTLSQQISTLKRIIATQSKGSHVL